MLPWFLVGNVFQEIKFKVSVGLILAEDVVVFSVFLDVLNSGQNDKDLVQLVFVGLLEMIRGVDFGFHLGKFDRLVGEELEVVFFDGFRVFFPLEDVHGGGVGDGDSGGIGAGLWVLFLVGLIIGEEQMTRFVCFFEWSLEEGGRMIVIGVKLVGHV